MDMRNEELPAGKLFCVRRPNGKYYRVFSKAQLDRLIESGQVQEDDTVQFITSITF